MPDMTELASTRPVALIMATTVLVFIWCNVAQSQPYCTQSFDVRPERSVTAFSWLPGSGELGVAAISCGSAELMRRQLFLESPTALSDTRLRAPTAARQIIQDALANARRDRGQLQRSRDSSAWPASKLAFRGILSSFGLATIVVDCFVPEPLVRTVCAGGLVGSYTEAEDLLRRPWGRAEADMAIAEADRRISSLGDLLSRAPAQTTRAISVRARERRRMIFEGLCGAVRSECL
jgi:hypothetical protein